jgi:two-component system, OmpR family, sensor kinase
MAAETAPPRKHTPLRAISHDLINSLSAVSGFLQLLVGPRAKDPVTPHQENMLTHMERACVHAVGLLRDMGDLSRLEEGTYLAPVSMDIGTLAAKALGEYRSLAGRRDIVLALDVPQDLPRVPADPHFLPRALDALLRTAGRLTPDGGSINLKIGASSQGLEGTLTHTGESLSPQTWEESFNASLEGPRPNEGYAALAAALAKRIFQGHGGGLTVASRPEGGHVFSFHLPA